MVVIGYPLADKMEREAPVRIVRGIAYFYPILHRGDPVALRLAFEEVLHLFLGELVNPCEDQISYRSEERG